MEPVIDTIIALHIRYSIQFDDIVHRVPSCCKHLLFASIAANIFTMPFSITPALCICLDTAESFE